MTFLKPSSFSLAKLLTAKPPGDLSLEAFQHLSQLVAIDVPSSEAEKKDMLNKLNEGIGRMRAMEQADTSHVDRPFHTLSFPVDAEELISPTEEHQTKWDVFQNSKIWLIPILLSMNLPEIKIFCFKKENSQIHMLFIRLLVGH
ncbi:mitochondrial glutamyl-tRNA amidotransferase complex subunit Gta3 [Schizosaccharomyces osmophilus]|uniref:Mitochondrial glutamyl-tRNA amidotransferase complex subunit Gta3 n=1 Tax=Schizosaccharomyces osmophilus TaxID=2545709 RepID=A0AAE9WGE4_9SCHI|nr:mitochondrial glutamyl-tRNA amidotransferase complex subunit Gta3 [Schizosaccharomyces osmophilus]WBW75159.1 mitochondrial glutamyl-tRNA amidotransferase complex subunit Gta3 [Schizosaccharomyces osmophilus]